MNRIAWILAGVAFATPGFGQGTVVFNNGAAGLVQTWASAYDPTPVPIASGASGSYVQLLYAPAGTPAGSFIYYRNGLQLWLEANPGWVVGPSSTFNTGDAGRFDGGVVALAGIAAGAQASYVLYASAPGFDSNYGANTPGEYRGLSPVFTTATGTDAASAVPLADSFGGMVMDPVPIDYIPEPCASTLLGLGVIALAHFRRRRAG
jgi:hypothetical protein